MSRYFILFFISSASNFSLPFFFQPKNVDLPGPYAQPHVPRSSFQVLLSPTALINLRINARKDIGLMPLSALWASWQPALYPFLTKFGSVVGLDWQAACGRRSGRSWEFEPLHFPARLGAVVCLCAVGVSQNTSEIVSLTSVGLAALFKPICSSTRKCGTLSGTSLRPTCLKPQRYGSSLRPRKKYDSFFWISYRGFFNLSPGRICFWWILMPSGPKKACKFPVHGLISLRDQRMPV